MGPVGDFLENRLGRRASKFDTKYINQDHDFICIAKALLYINT